MTRNRSIDEMPSRRELTIGMTILLIVGGFVVTRGSNQFDPWAAGDAPRIADAGPSIEQSRPEAPPPLPDQSPALAGPSVTRFGLVPR